MVAIESLNALSDSEAQIVEQQARSKLVECNKLNDVIGAQIFQILARFSRVLYYPLDDDDVWGFVEKFKKIHFVCINTSIAYDKQVFVAAHELYHIWFNGSNEELILARNLEELVDNDAPISTNELKANRFAAAFLVEEALLKQEILINDFKIDSLDTKDILKLANLFVVPYKTMLRRLYEIGILNQSRFTQYSTVTNAELDILRSRLGLVMPSQNKAIALDNLVETAMSLYERDLITVEKLQQILRYANLSLADVGVQITIPEPLTEAELLKLLEE